MKLKTILFSITLILLPVVSIAGSGHDHGSEAGHTHSHTPVNQQRAQANATDIVAALISRNVLESSWSSVVASSVEKKIINDNPEWLVIFINDKIADINKQKLYVFLTLGGDYIAANFTGK